VYGELGDVHAEALEFSLSLVYCCCLNLCFMSTFGEGIDDLPSFIGCQVTIGNGKGGEGRCSAF